MHRLCRAHRYQPASLTINTAHRQSAFGRLGVAGSGVGRLAWPSGATLGAPTPVAAG